MVFPLSRYLSSEKEICIYTTFQKNGHIVRCDSKVILTVVELCTEYAEVIQDLMCLGGHCQKHHSAVGRNALYYCPG